MLKHVETTPRHETSRTCPLNSTDTCDKEIWPSPPDQARPQTTAASVDERHVVDHVVVQYGISPISQWFCLSVFALCLLLPFLHSVERRGKNMKEHLVKISSCTLQQTNLLSARGLAAPVDVYGCRVLLSARRWESLGRVGSATGGNL